MVSASGPVRGEVGVAGMKNPTYSSESGVSFYPQEENDLAADYGLA